MDCKSEENIVRAMDFFFLNIKLLNEKYPSQEMNDFYKEFENYVEFYRKNIHSDSDDDIKYADLDLDCIKNILPDIIKIRSNNSEEITSRFVDGHLHRLQLHFLKKDEHFILLSKEEIMSKLFEKNTNVCCKFQRKDFPIKENLHDLPLLISYLLCENCLYPKDSHTPCNFYKKKGVTNICETCGFSIANHKPRDKPCDKFIIDLNLESGSCPEFFECLNCRFAYVEHLEYDNNLPCNKYELSNCNKICSKCFFHFDSHKRTNIFNILPKKLQENFDFNLMALKLKFKNSIEKTINIINILENISYK